MAWLWLRVIPADIVSLFDFKDPTASVDGKKMTLSWDLQFRPDRVGPFWEIPKGV